MLSFCCSKNSRAEAACAAIDREGFEGGIVMKRTWVRWHDAMGLTMETSIRKSFPPNVTVMSILIPAHNNSIVHVFYMYRLQHDQLSFCTN